MKIIEETLKNSFKIWNKLKDTEKNNLVKYSKLITYKKGDILYQGSKTCIGLIIVVKGSLRAYLSSDNGKQVTLYKLYENDICLFSASCIMKDINFDINLECEEDLEAIIIPPEKYEFILQDSTIISNYVGKILSSRFSDTIWVLEQFVFHSLDKRLANYLLEQKLKNNVLTITHEKIANELGSAREVISRMLKYFENEKIIKLNRNNITLLEIQKLERIAEK